MPATDTSETSGDFNQAPWSTSLENVIYTKPGKLTNKTTCVPPT